MAGRSQKPRTPAPGDPSAKAGLHPRNRFRLGYDFSRLIRVCPELAGFVRPNPYGKASIDFANPAAVKALNRALLVEAYGIKGWELPEPYLCPPIPGRADHLHHLADLLSRSNGGTLPPGIRALDIGVGANAIYPLLGQGEYGWHFVGSDIDAGALAVAERFRQANPGLRNALELRLQPRPELLFRGVIREGERFDLSLCNPPFHASAAAAREGTQRKLRNLGMAQDSQRGPRLNFGGQAAELWCPGGEEGFIVRMIEESLSFRNQCFWFTTLVSKSATLPALHRALGRVRALERHTLEMAQGQKRSRILAWTFLDAEAREAWRQARWTPNVPS